MSATSPAILPPLRSTLLHFPPLSTIFRAPLLPRFSRPFCCPPLVPVLGHLDAVRCELDGRTRRGTSSRWTARPRGEQSSRSSTGCGRSSTGTGPILARSVIEGKPEVVRTAMVVLLAEGHLLIEDVPGVGKTMLSQGAGPLHRLLGAPDPVHPGPAALRRHRRLDLQPGDPRSSSSGPAGSSPTSWSATRSTGPPPRPSPRCSSAWRSARSPSTATTYQLEAPFMVIATQNPIEMEGTYALPEAQRDRFMARVSMGYPVEAAEIAMLDAHDRGQPARRPRAGDRRRRDPQADRAWSAACHVSDGRAAVRRRAGHRHPPLARPRLGASPRATLHLVRAAKACAAPGTGGTTSSPTTYTPWRRPCSPTGCCPPSRRLCPAAAPPRSVASLIGSVPAPDEAGGQ